MSMKLKLSDINLMLDIIFDYKQYFERKDNEVWYDEVDKLENKLINIVKSNSKNRGENN